ncbi:MAG: (d)CMP kinase [Proteobacteria bacterium]|nr:(d)CMP kinase [Pseudomonadota bacterium]MBU4297370.1 (d)CMP kinase [Pseudomonadota bacterium]MCG2749615.1 (d)CMP kinase [Desulfobulbaceae bacterium]
MAGNDIITIDGPSGSGKSTISRLVAARLGFTYLDTGAMYRAVGFKARKLGIDLSDGVSLAGMLENIDLVLAPGEGDTRVILDQEDISLAIRTAEMGLVASKVSAQPVVRARLTEMQRRMGQQGRVVVEGRDTGTVVFPGARHKFFLDAKPEERARRRCLQLREKGLQADEQEIFAQIIKRDQDDSGRSLAPLKPAADAVIIDTSHMNIDEVVSFMLEKVEKPRQNSQNNSQVA